MQSPGAGTNPARCRSGRKPIPGKRQPNEVGNVNKDLLRAIDRNLDFIFCEIGNHQKVSRRKVTWPNFVFSSKIIWAPDCRGTQLNL